MNESSDNLETALVASVTSKIAVELAKDYAEIGVDALLAGGVLEEIPSIKTMLAVYHLPASVSDAILMKKLVKFLGPLHHISYEERVNLIEKLAVDPGYSRKVGEHFLELLTRIDSNSKPEMIAKILLGYATGTIDAQMLHRLNSAVESLPFYEISNVRAFYELELKQRLDLASNTPQALMTAGLAAVKSGFGTLVFEPTATCEKFLELSLDRDDV